MKKQITVKKQVDLPPFHQGLPEKSPSNPRGPMLWGLLGMILIAWAAAAVSHNFEDEIDKIVPETMSDASTYNKKPSGYSALFELCDRVGLKPIRWQSPYRQLKGSGTLFLVAPAYPPRDVEVDQILAWVAKGNNLVYLDYFTLQTGKGFLHRLAVQATDSVSLVNKDLQPNGAPQVMAHVTNLNLTAETRIELSRTKRSDPAKGSANTNDAGSSISGTHAPPAGDVGILAKDQHGSLILDVPFGNGHCLLSSAPGMCCNRRVADEKSRGNFQLLANWLRDCPGNLYFDEKSQGNLESLNFVVWLTKGRLGLFFCEMLALFLIALVSLNQRFGPPRLVSNPRRISNLEFVDGMAHTYRKAKAHDTAWSILFGTFRTRLCKGLGASPSDPADVLAVAWSEATGIKETELREFLEKAAAMESAHISREEMLEMVARCDNLTERSKNFLAIAATRRQGA